MPSEELKRMQALADKTTVITPPATDPHSADLPNYKAEFYRVQQPRWELVDDVWTGTDAIRKAGEKYMPKGTYEGKADYDARIKVAPFYNAYKRTIRGLTGIAHGKPFRLNKEAHALFQADWEDIDLAGSKGSVFCKTLFKHGLHYGHVGIFVDYPTVPDAKVMSAGEERERNLRPYWIPITPPMIQNASGEVRNGRTVLKHVTLLFHVDEPFGRFGTQCRPEYREYWVEGSTVKCQIWRWSLPDGSTEKVLTKVGVPTTLTNQTEIPLAIAYLSESEGLLCSSPTLYELAHTNLDHYRVLADHRWSLHKASVPILVFKNRVGVGKEVAVNPDQGIDVSGEHGDVKYVEHQGSALGQTRTELQDIESRMAGQGLAMLQRQTRTAETATANILDKAEQYSTLSDAVLALKDAVEQAFRFHAKYRKLSPAPIVEANQQFDALSMDSAMIGILSQLEVAGQITLDTLWTMLERASILPDGFDRVEELAKLAKAGKLQVQTTPFAGTEDEDEELPDAQKKTDDAPAGGTQQS